MNNKRRHTLCILILIMTSLFLSSCGEPSLCSLTGLSLKGTVSDNSVIINIGTSDSDLSKLSDGPGLLLCYCFGDNTLVYEDAVSKFANIVKTKLIIDENNIILTLDDGNTPLYVFQKDYDGARVYSPGYCYNYYNDINGTTLDKTITLSYISDRDFNLESVPFYTTTLPEQTGNTQYIYIFGAFSAEQGSFSNNYWSALKYLGRLEINYTE